MLQIKKSCKKNLFIPLFIIVSLVMMIMCLCVGRYKLSLTDIWNVIRYGKSCGDLSAYNVLVHIRLPRILISYLIGIALSVSGAAYQSLFNNRLISPGILGVDAGACVGAGICILLGVGSFGITTVAFVFGLLSAALTLMKQKVARSSSPLLLVLAGMVVGALMNSAIGIIKYLADGENKLASLTFWMLGDISGAEMKQVLWVLPVVVICTTILLLMGMRLNAISLGEKEASSLGINYKRNRMIIVCCSTLLTCMSVSIAGSIDWIGLIIPNIVRSIFGCDNKKIIPYSILFGGVFMVIVDTLARTLSPSEIPLGIITGIFGAVVYFFIIIGKKGVV